jgi:signal peptidase I
MMNIMTLKINQKSMEPILFDGQHVLVTRKKKYNKGDIIVFSDNFDGLYKIKYIFGIPNETLGFKEKTLNLISDDDDYLLYQKVINLKDNEFYVLGYNDLMSTDSRHFGPISTEQIVGKLILRYYPLNSFKVFK